MQRSSILAHRGLFLNDKDKNSIEAFRRAFDAGFGIETDLRDLNGSIVVSHDPPIASTNLLSFQGLLSTYLSYSSSGRLALNIKSDGLSALVHATIKNNNLNPARCFVFDMSVPDALSYLDGTVPVYTRISDHEPVASFLSKSDGVWVDNFDGTFQQVLKSLDLVQQGIKVALVSSELHKRDHNDLWRDILLSGLHRSPLFELCTDFPVEACQYFCTE